MGSSSLFVGASAKFPRGESSGLKESIRNLAIKAMRVLFISANTEKINMTTLPLGLACVAAATRHIRRMGFLLLGGPGETRKSVEESLAFADSLKLESMKVTVGVRIYPYTALAKTAIEDGVISSGDDLLFPEFYLASGLENWLPPILKNWSATHPHWLI